ncbi:nucleolar protein dao-5 isoform X1 [Drosophila simulans]|uniref:GD17350 n=1 Tax=Drosophila simulans TaxID=7240 RepID=B4R6M0_DROSI|nr:nucleolar protein dao-5 isoform X1 [Drosophila simulans]EDX18219.1 GD17350 [Drosophila simulans]KMZ10359.1 uncharacterized protein Dsimw501_GD17350, isoform A [Drosophila simulans]
MAKASKKLAESKRRNGVAVESENEEMDQQKSNGTGRSSRKTPNKRKAKLTVASGSEDSDGQTSTSNAADVPTARNKRKVVKARNATTSARKNGKKIVIEDSDDDAYQSDVDPSADSSPRKPDIKRQTRRSVRGETEDSNDLPSTSKAAAHASPIKKRKLSRVSTSSVKNGKKVAEKDSESEVDAATDDDKPVQPQKIAAKPKASPNVKKAKGRGRQTAVAKKADDSIDPEKQWEVEKIIDHVATKEGDMFKIRWKKYGAKDDSWEPRKNLACDALIEKFMRKQVTEQNVDVKELRESPKKTERLVDECYPRTNLHNRIERSSKRSAAKNRIFYGEE